MANNIKLGDIEVQIPSFEFKNIGGVIAIIVAVIIIYYLEKKIPYVPLIGAILITIFGGLTIFFKNPIFL